MERKKKEEEEEKKKEECHPNNDWQEKEYNGRNIAGGKRERKREREGEKKIDSREQTYDHWSCYSYYDERKKLLDE
jgi:hypothetical protein